MIITVSITVTIVQNSYNDGDDNGYYDHENNSNSNEI